jgi:hypothetical protein
MRDGSCPRHTRPVQDRGIEPGIRGSQITAIIRTISQLEAEGYSWIGCECCKGTVWVPFRMIRETIPGLSSWTLDELGAKMKCDKCGKRPRAIRGRTTRRGLRGAIEGLGPALSGEKNEAARNKSLAASVNLTGLRNEVPNDPRPRAH